jgi:hypothetical protein
VEAVAAAVQQLVVEAVEDPLVEEQLDPLVVELDRLVVPDRQEEVAQDPQAAWYAQEELLAVVPDRSFAVVERYEP